MLKEFSTAILDSQQCLTALCRRRFRHVWSQTSSARCRWAKIRHVRGEHFFVTNISLGSNRDFSECQRSENATEAAVEKMEWCSEQLQENILDKNEHLRTFLT
jgi:hypothetical protein